jgi:hypothetical protein
MARRPQTGRGVAAPPESDASEPRTRTVRQASAPGATSSPTGSGIGGREAGLPLRRKFDPLNPQGVPLKYSKTKRSLR